MILSDKGGTHGTSSETARHGHAGIGPSPRVGRGFHEGLREVAVGALALVVNPSERALAAQERAFSEHGWLAPLAFAGMAATVAAAFFMTGAM